LIPVTLIKMVSLISWQWRQAQLLAHIQLEVLALS